MAPMTPARNQEEIENLSIDELRDALNSEQKEKQDMMAQTETMLRHQSVTAHMIANSRNEFPIKKETLSASKSYQLTEVCKWLKKVEVDTDGDHSRAMRYVKSCGGRF